MAKGRLNQQQLCGFATYAVAASMIKFILQEFGLCVWAQLFFLRFRPNFFPFFHIFDETSFSDVFDQIFFYVFTKFLFLAKRFFTWRNFIWRTSFGETLFGELHLTKLHLAKIGYTNPLPGWTDKQTHTCSIIL